MPTPDLAVLLNGFPRLSETFVLQELLELEKQDVRLHVIALKRPAETVQLERTAKLQGKVEYLTDMLAAARTGSTLAFPRAHARIMATSPARYLRALRLIRSSPHYSVAALRASVVVANRLLELGAPPLYVHFAHKPATIGHFASRLAGVPYGLSAHAKDIWLTPPAELAGKVRDAEVVLTCTSSGYAHLSELAAGRTPVELVYHGVDVDVPPPLPSREGPAVILSAGRLIKKKGHPTLLHAIALLQERRLDYRLRIAGEGPEWATLQRLVHRLGIAERVTFLGPLTETELAAEYRRADVFALACEELESGDRDGIPNVILEAMAHALPVVSTRCGGLDEAVVDGRCGLLVAQRDPEALASALGRLLDDAQLRLALGRRGRDHVVTHFDRSQHLGRAVEALRSARLIRRVRAGRVEEPRPVRAVA